nr:GGDEF domain-containing protein [Lachnospiraceae bacterium]
MDEMHYQLDLLKAMNEKLLGNDKMFRMICGTSSNAFLFYSFSENRFETLGCWEQYFEFEVQNQTDFQNILRCVKDEYSSVLEAALFCERAGESAKSAECEMAEGSKWVEFEVTISYDENHRPSEKIVRVRDITRAKRQTEDLKYMAYYDALTGLYNRNYFVRLLSEWVRKAQTEHAKVSVMCIRLDEFRKINDAMGMIAGDEVIQLFGLFLKDLQNEDTIAAHFYEDMFFVALYDPFGNNTTEHIYRKVCNRLEDTFHITSGSAEVKSTVSVGVAEYPESARNSLELINCAEIVMLQRSEKGRNSIEYFETPMLTDFMENIQLENQLKEAIESGDFELYYQPQYDSLSNKLRGVEALIRWRKQDGKLVSPAVFIPIAEKDGLIVQIGNWVLEEGIRCFKKWYDKYQYPMMLSLNISAIQYKRKDFVHKLLRLLDKYQVNPELIELEITESVLIDDFESVVDKLHTLKEYGIKISLDDFGTGFSSLSYLKGLPIDTLKIDKSFIDTVIDDNSTRVITESIIAMVKKLGCETVAEGVETQEQFEYLKGINCDNIQGFLLGRPMPASEVDKLLAAV